MLTQLSHWKGGRERRRRRKGFLKALGETWLIKGPSKSVSQGGALGVQRSATRVRPRKAEHERGGRGHAIYIRTLWHSVAYQSEAPGTKNHRFRHDWREESERETA